MIPQFDTSSIQQAGDSLFTGLHDISLYALQSYGPILVGVIAIVVVIGIIIGIMSIGGKAVSGGQ